MKFTTKLIAKSQIGLITAPISYMSMVMQGVKVIVTSQSVKFLIVNHVRP